MRKNERGPGVKYDEGKPMWDLLDISLVEKMVEVLTFGASKYGPESWRRVPNLSRRYYSALMRHLAAWRKGELCDKETGLPHLAHAMCNIMFLHSAGPIAGSGKTGDGDGFECCDADGAPDGGLPVQGASVRDAAV